MFARGRLIIAPTDSIVDFAYFATRPSDCQKASQSLRHKPQIRCKSFSAGACTWQKILLRLQVWNLSSEGGQIMRAADCKLLAESPKGVFRQTQARTAVLQYALILRKNILMSKSRNFLEFPPQWVETAKKLCYNVK